MTLKTKLHGLVISILFLSHAAAATQAQVLEQGSTVQREIAGKQTHSYEVTVASGQYLRVTVGQRIGLVVVIFGPDNEKIVENSVGPFLPAGVSTVARTSGIYRIEVTSPAEASYRINLEELRQANSNDETRVAAERVVIEGRRLVEQPRPGLDALRDALAKFDRALDLWRSIDDHNGEAETLWFVGNAHRSMFRPERARDCFNQALGLAKETGYLRLEAVAAYNLGDISGFDLGDWQAGLDYYDRALAASRDAGDRKLEGVVLNAVAYTYQSLGDFQKALSYFEELLAIHRIEENRSGEATALKDIGRMHYALGDKQKAVDYFERAVTNARAAGDSALESQLLGLIGIHFLVKEEFDRALDYYNRALLIQRANNNRPGQANLLSNIAQTYQAMREKQKALDAFDQALLLWRTTGNRGAAARILNDIGSAYYEFGEPQKALPFEEQALEIQRQLGIVPPLEANSGVNRSLGDMAKIYAALGDTQKAIALTNQLLTYTRSTANRKMEAEMLRKLALLWLKIGNLDEAHRNIESAVQIVESTRASFTSTDLRSTYFVSAKDYYELYIDVLMQLNQKHPTDGFDAAALQASEGARARSLLDLLGEAHANIRRGITPELVARELDIQRRLNDKAQEQRQLLSGKHTAAQADAVESEVRAILKEQSELDAKIRATNPAYASLTRPSSLSLKEIQQQVLDPDTILLEYALGSEHSYLWLVTLGSVTSYSLPKRKDIESASRRVSELLTARQPRPRETAKQYHERVAVADAQYPKEASALGEMLLGHVASQLGKKRLLIVADGALQYLGFAALPLPGSNRPLIVDHEIVNVPSASVLATLRRDTTARVPAERAVAVLADPVFDSDDPRVKVANPNQPQKNGERSLGIDLKRALREFDPSSGEQSITRLPFSRKEADAILVSAPQGARMKALDFNASREVATGVELSRYQIVHFATHAMLNGDHPELSGIVFSLVDEQGRPRDGFLRLHDIYNLNLPAELVVLSACKTALGKEIRGEGLIGLTRGFMFAGTRRVVASLWKVDDWATAELMKRFYKKMLVDKQRPAAALRAAQIEMWQQPKWRAPFYWAAFILQGEPN